MAETNKRPTATQIKEWKAKHGELFEFTVDGKIIILREPKIVDLERAQASDPKKKKPYNFNRSLKENCMLYEDDDFSKDEARLVALWAEMDEIIEVKEATVKKL